MPRARYNSPMRLQTTFTAEPVQIRAEPRVIPSVTSATCKDPQTGTFSADRNSCCLIVLAYIQKHTEPEKVCDRGQKVRRALRRFL